MAKRKRVSTSKDPIASTPAREIVLMDDERRVLDVNGTSLDEWIALLREPPPNTIFIRNKFPTEAHKNEWFHTAHLRPESDVKLLLRHFLVSTGSNLQDDIDAQFLLTQIDAGSITTDLQEHDRRLLQYAISGRTYPVWEGLGWVIDLLPHRPRWALNVIDAFFQPYYCRLTDNYLTGLYDAKAVIRSRYIESSHTANDAAKVLLGLDWRELEWLCGAAYKDMGFRVVVTPHGDDDGVDVFATTDAPGQTGLVVIQAKKWKESNPVGKAEVRELLGAVTQQRATKGVLATTGRYESGARKESMGDPRIELLGRKQLLQLLNEHCGADWFKRVDRLINFAKRDNFLPARRPATQTRRRDK